MSMIMYSFKSWTPNHTVKPWEQKAQASTLKLFGTQQRKPMCSILTMEESNYI